MISIKTKFIAFEIVSSILRAILYFFES